MVKCLTEITLLSVIYIKKLLVHFISLELFVNLWYKLIYGNNYIDNHKNIRGENVNTEIDNNVLMHTYPIEYLKTIVFDVKSVMIFILLAVFLFLLRHKISIKYQMFLDFMRKKIQNETIKNFLLVLANIISSVYFTAIITIIVPYFIDAYESKINLIVGVWIFLVIINALCSNYVKGRDKAQKWFLTALRNFKRVQKDTAEAIYKTRIALPKIITAVADDRKVSEEIQEKYFTFDKAAQIACDVIYETIKDVAHYTNHYVTIYKRYQEKDGKDCPNECPLKEDCKRKNKKDEWTKMIACRHKDGKTSMSAEQEHCFEYCVEKNSGENTKEVKKHFYIHFFENNETNIQVVTGKMEINSKFLFHESCKDREEGIEEYIGIPLCHPEKISKNNLRADITTDTRNHQHVTHAVIQIDFQHKGVLGRTNQSIQEFVENVFGGIIEYLETALQVEEIIVDMLKNVLDISQLADNTVKNEMEKLAKAQKGSEDMIREYVALDDKYKELLKIYNESL